MRWDMKHGRTWYFSTGMLVVALDVISCHLTAVDAFAIGNNNGRNQNRPFGRPPIPITVQTILERKTNTRVWTKMDSEDEEDQDLEFIFERWEKADPLEIRLDATLAACLVLARFLVYDTTLPKKTIPGFEIEDIIMLVNVFSSATVLAILWTMAGLVTGVFEDRGFDPLRLISTSALAGPLWLAIEIFFGWPPAGVADPTADAATTIIVGCIGLCATTSETPIIPVTMLQVVFSTELCQIPTELCVLSNILGMENHNYGFFKSIV
jgi:hypothetical protein